MSNDKRFEWWWIDNAVTLAEFHGSAERYRASKESARAAWNACLSEEDRQACVEALGLASCDANCQPYEWADEFAAVRKRLEGE